MNKKLPIIGVAILSIIGIALIIISAITSIKGTQKNMIPTSYTSVDNNGSEDIPSYSIIDNPIQISYPAVEKIDYTNPTGKFGYQYPSTWEFVPKRMDMGLRPKLYNCDCKNEIVTVLSFDLNGRDFKSVASEYDGVIDFWKDITVNSNKGIFYQHESNDLKYITYWFHKDEIAVKLEFREKDQYASIEERDNTKYYNDFMLILNSFKFY
jgi:hypothetical protein